MENQEELYQLAKKRVKKLKSFYSHLSIYIVVNCFIVVVNYNNLDAGESYFQWQNFATLFFWGIGLTFHALPIFLPNFILGSDWEENKINEILKKDKKTNWE